MCVYVYIFFIRQQVRTSYLIQIQKISILSRSLSIIRRSCNNFGRTNHVLHFTHEYRRKRNSQRRKRQNCTLSDINLTTIARYFPDRQFPPWAPPLPSHPADNLSVILAAMQHCRLLPAPPPPPPSLP